MQCFFIVFTIAFINLLTLISIPYTVTPKTTERGDFMDEPLRIYTLGEFKVKCNGNLLSPHNRSNDKPWLLFKYLITERGKNIHPEIIMNNLWPDQNIKNPTHTVTNLVYRLRKNLNSKEKDCQYIINCQGRCFFNKESEYWLDIEEFINLCKKANLVSKEKPIEAFEYYEQAFNMYNGDYLPEIPYYDWVIPSRNNYHWYYIENVIEYIKLLKEYDRHEKIIEVCEKSFNIEPLEEEIHTIYMSSLLELGKIGHARSHYKYAKELFNKNLDLSNMPKLEELYNKNFDKNYLNIIQDKLNERDNIRGAFICSNDIFRMIYKLEKRRAERNNKSIFLAYIKFDNQNFINNNIYYIEKTLETELRKGDIITKWDKDQYLMLLLELTKSNASKVLKRVCDSICSETGIDEKELQINFQNV